jgi:hypothetical protein
MLFHLRSFILLPPIFYLIFLEILHNIIEIDTCLPTSLLSLKEKGMFCLYLYQFKY